MIITLSTALASGFGVPVAGGSTGATVDGLDEQGEGGLGTSGYGIGKYGNPENGA